MKAFQCKYLSLGYSPVEDFDVEYYRYIYNLVQGMGLPIKKYVTYRNAFLRVWILPAAILIITAFACGSRSKKGTLEIADFRVQWDSLRVLDNPHKGWYHHMLDNNSKGYGIQNDSLFFSFPGMDHLYLRLAWSYLEPEEGIYDWQLIDTIVNQYVQLGYGISFRITSKETGTFPETVGQEEKGVQYATPLWVMHAGAKGQVAENGSIKSWVPDWDDPVFLDKLDQFHRSFAARYDGLSWVRYVDIGSIGEWGEGHTSFSTRIPPTPEEVRANMDVFLKHYKKTRLVCTDDLLYYGKSETETEELYAYAVSKGITLRDDSPMVDWYMEQNADTWSVSHPHFYDPLYLDRPIIFELQHYSMVKNDGNWSGRNGSDIIDKYGQSGATFMRKAIETMHATYIGFHGHPEEWLTDNPALTTELANYCGYWYFPVEATFPSRFRRDENHISMTWINKGVAPAYDPFQLSIRFESVETGNFFDFSMEDSGNRSWLPGIRKTESYSLTLPGDFSKGRYILKVKLQERTAHQTGEVLVGLNEEFLDKENYFTLGKVIVD